MDLTRFKELSDGDPTGLLELIELYLTKTAEQFQDLEKAFSLNAKSEITRLAHSMVGANAMVGMDSLVHILRNVEAAGERSDFAGARRSFQLACDEFKVIRTELKKTSDGIAKKTL